MLPFFEKREEKLFCKYKPCINFPLHVHRHMELLYIIKGIVDAQIGKQNYTLHSGELAVIFPEQMHAYRTIEEGSVLLVVAPISFMGEYQRMCCDYEPVCPKLSACHISGRLADNLAELHSANQEFLHKALVQLIFARLLELMSLRKKEVGTHESILYQAMNLIAEHYQEDIHLEAVAQQLGVSKWYLSHVLNCTLGVGFREYVNALRIEQARQQLLSTEDPVIDIAMACGFQNLRTFNRAFLSLNRCSPREYRKNFKSCECASLHYDR